MWDVPCGRGCDKQGARPVNGICGTYFAVESYVMHLCDSATLRREGATQTEADVMFAVDSWGRGCERVSGRPSSVLLMTTRTMTLLECVRRVGASPGRPGREELRTQKRVSSERRTGHDRDKPGKDILPPVKGTPANRNHRTRAGKGGEERERKDEQDRGPGRSRGSKAPSERNGRQGWTW